MLCSRMFRSLERRSCLPISAGIESVHGTRRDCSRREALIWLQVRDQVCVLSFSPFLHWASNFVYCSFVRIPFASCMYLASLALEQPAFSCSAITASIFVFCSGVRFRLANEA